MHVFELTHVGGYLRGRHVEANSFGDGGEVTPLFYMSVRELVHPVASPRLRCLCRCCTGNQDEAHEQRLHCLNPSYSSASANSSLGPDANYEATKPPMTQPIACDTASCKHYWGEQG